MIKRSEPQSLGEYLKEARERAGLSQRELGKQADVHHSYIARIESGELATPIPEYLQRLADVLEIDVTELLAFLGVKPEMPEPRVYFRRKFGVDADQADILAQLIEDYQAKQEKGGNT